MLKLPEQEKFNRIIFWSACAVIVIAALLIGNEFLTRQKKSLDNHIKTDPDIIKSDSVAPDIIIDSSEVKNEIIADGERRFIAVSSDQFIDFQKNEIRDTLNTDIMHDEADSMNDEPEEFDRTLQEEMERLKKLKTPAEEFNQAGLTVAREQKDYAKALAYYLIAIDAAPFKPVYYYNAACMYARLGRTKEALEYLDRFASVSHISKKDLVKKLKDDKDQDFKDIFDIITRWIDEN
jgi:tetratricopeptide (TPR) repeat protein